MSSPPSPPSSPPEAATIARSPSPNQDVPSVTIEIISHAHAPPLDPPADVKFDLRRIENPPRQQRNEYDGRAKRMRKEFLQDPQFETLVETARKEVSDLVAARQKNITAPSEAICVRVESVCIRGKHRSVAFAEELRCKQHWPKGWQVVVSHRDVDRQKPEVDGRSKRNSKRTVIGSIDGEP